MSAPLDKSELLLAKLMPHVRASILQNRMDQLAEASITTTIYDIFENSMDLKEINLELEEYFSSHPELAHLIPKLNTINLE